MTRTGVGDGWCRLCGALVAVSDARRRWWHVTTAPHAEPLSAAAVQSVLSAPVPPSSAVTAGPTGRQNLLLGMRWGCVATVWGVWPWTDNEVAMFRAVTVARQHHVSSQELNSEAPPVRLLTQDSSVDWLTLWQQLRAWRHTPQLTLAARAN